METQSSALVRKLECGWFLQSLALTAWWEKHCWRLPPASGTGLGFTQPSPHPLGCVLPEADKATETGTEDRSRAGRAHKHTP